MSGKSEKAKRKAFATCTHEVVERTRHAATRQLYRCVKCGARWSTLVPARPLRADEAHRYREPAARKTEA